MLPRLALSLLIAGKCASYTVQHAQLTLVRHGQSEWNAANRFTGWIDVDITERGIIEARQAGNILKEQGLQHDLVCTSCLRRAIRTACLMLSASDQCFVPLIKDVRLNEQHSGALTGYNKRALAKAQGIEQVMQWRRAYDVPPPPLSEEDPFQRALVQDERYRDSPIAIPDAESLANTSVRVGSIWEETIAPALRQGQNVMVVAHGNTLRALVKLVDGVSDANACHLDLPSACPLVYDLDAALHPVGMHGLWGSYVPRRGRFLMSDRLVAEAQRAMRLQCLEDIQVIPDWSALDGT